jgi:hypothetical protein
MRFRAGEPHRCAALVAPRERRPSIFLSGHGRSEPYQPVAPYRANYGSADVSNLNGHRNIRSEMAMSRRAIEPNFADAVSKACVRGGSWRIASPLTVGFVLAIVLYTEFS